MNAYEKITIDPEFAALIPPLSKEERDQLEANLLEHGGARDALVVWNVDDRLILIDGHNRFEICMRLGLLFNIEEIEFEDRNHAKEWIIRNQFGRRNLSAYVRTQLALQLEATIAARSRQGERTDLLQNSAKSLDRLDTREEVAKLANVSHDTVAKVKRIDAQGAPELVDVLKAGGASISAAAEVASLPVEEQREIVSQGPKAIVEAAKAIREGKSPHVAHNSGNNEWYTPAEYIEAAREVLGTIDLDPASSDIANQTVQAKHYFTAEVDGLAHEWSGRIWMNPPYAGELIGQFTSKLMQHYDEGKIEAAIVLVNNATETKWFQEMAQEASAVCFPRGRVRFLDPNGQPGAPLQGQALLYLGDNVEGFKDSFSQFGVVFS